MFKHGLEDWAGYGVGYGVESESALHVTSNLCCFALV